MARKTKIETQKTPMIDAQESRSARRKMQISHRERQTGATEHTQSDGSPRGETGTQAPHATLPSQDATLPTAAALN